jgi:hypothetical protein
MNTAEQIRTARGNLETMKQAVADIDRRIVTLKSQSASVKPREAGRLQTELASLEIQRTAAGALVSEAESQLLARQDEHRNSIERTRCDLGRIAAECEEAAKRFDDAMRAASAAFDQLEASAEPLARAGFLVDFRSGTHRRNIKSAFEKHFAARFGDIAARESTMANRVQMMLAGARQNAARMKLGETA